jgi:NAD-dependent deacetylase
MSVPASSVTVTPFAASQAAQASAVALAKARRIVVFSGAGMSAESGIITFRDPEAGVWKIKLALALFAVPFGWRWVPSIAWWCYRKFHRPIAVAKPNAGHVAAAQLREALKLMKMRCRLPRRMSTRCTNAPAHLHRTCTSFTAPCGVTAV